MRKMLLVCAALILVGSLNANAQSFRAAVHQARVAARVERAIERAELRALTNPYYGGAYGGYGAYGASYGGGYGVGLNTGFVPPPPPPILGSSVEVFRLRPHAFRYR